MKRSISVLVFVFLCNCGVTVAEVEELNSASEWIYLVKTEPSEPNREREFNEWYDKIDIPDVLAVPSFLRARRAVAQSAIQYPDVRPGQGDGSYVALYDIAADNIDKSIIDLYVAARKMNALGRSSDALRVVEANYYRRLFGKGSQSASTGPHRYFLVQKIICCAQKDAASQYGAWFTNTIVPKLERETRFIETGLFTLYRVMEELALEDDEQSHLLAIFVVDVETAGQALADLEQVLGGFRYTGFEEHRYEVRDAILYRQMSDILSE